MKQSKEKSLYKRFLKFLLSFDKLGKQIQLQVNKRETHNNLFGSLLSISIMIFVVYTFADMVYDLFSKKNPILNYKTEYQKDPELTELKEESFQVAVTLTDGQGQPIPQLENETLYLPILSVCNRTTSLINGQMEMINKCNLYNMVRCSSVNDIKLLKQMGLEQGQLDLSYCLPDEARKKQIFLQGYSFSSVFQVIAIDVYKCSQSLITNGTCAEQVFIDQKITNGYIGFIISDRLFNPQEPENPFIIYGKTIITSFDSGLYKILYAYLRHNYIQTIVNFYYYFYATKCEFKELLFEKLNEYTSPSSDGNLASFVIQLDDKKISYFRTYGTILDILADIGGLLQLIGLVAKIIMAPISALMFELFLANQIFALDANHKQQSKNRKEQIFPDNLNCHDQKNIQILKFLSNESSEQDIKSFKQIFKEKLNGLKFTFLNYLFLRNKVKNQQFKGGVNIINEQLDYVYLIRKIWEIEKLKLILLSPNQLKLFENLPRPKIFAQQGINSFQNQHVFSQQKIKFLDKLKQSFDAYRQINEKQPTQIDKQLINLLDPAFINLFNEAIKCIFIIKLYKNKMQEFINNKQQNKELNTNNMIFYQLRINQKVKMSQFKQFKVNNYEIFCFQWGLIII